MIVLQLLEDILAILPPALVLLSIVDSWIPHSTVESHLGAKSGVRGWLTALLLGSFAAGPLFAAFPIAKSLFEKATRTANVVIFLGAWATIKLPMLLMESHFLGMRFSLLRLALTVPFIIAIGLIVEKLSACAGKSGKFQDGPWRRNDKHSSTPR